MTPLAARPRVRFQNALSAAAVSCEDVAMRGRKMHEALYNRSEIVNKPETQEMRFRKNKHNEVGRRHHSNKKDERNQCSVLITSLRQGLAHIFLH